jgi:HSP20 family molecular chaperone IbpA
MAMTDKTKETKEMTKTQKQELTGAESTRPGRLFTPTVDILETRDAIVVLADMPGVDADGLSIDLRESVLTIDGEVEESGAENEQWLLREYGTGSFHRQFRLSNAIDQGKIDASLRDGVLRLTLPKAEAARPRKIEVKAG